MATVDHIRSVVADLPRSYEVLVRDQIKFRVGQIVYLSFSLDESRMGFAFPKEEREALVSSDPETYLMPAASDMRFNWAVVRLDRISDSEAGELALDAWSMVVPQKVWRAWFGE